MTLAELNLCDRQGFVDAIGWVFESSPWVAERAWALRPFATRADLHRAMICAVDAATPEEQLALLRAHPDLGSHARMSAASTSEQAGAGLDAMPSADSGRLRALNAAYRDKFGFPFLFAVKGATPADVLAALDLRSSRPFEDEVAEALRQVHRIAWFRLETVVTD